MSIILDAGPCLNFLAVGQQNVLIQWAGVSQSLLAAPERVDQEVQGKAKSPRFQGTGVANSWNRMTTAGRIKVLEDDVGSGALLEAIERISDQPWQQRMNRRESLGEVLVLAHASGFAQGGQTVFVLIDDGDAQKLARKEIRWLREHGASGEVRLVETYDIVHRAGREQGWIKKGQTWEQVYTAMRKFDDGLEPLETARQRRAPRS